MPWPVLDASGRPAPVPTITCGSQRPALNTAPAIAADGTIYDISRASLNDYWGYLVAINPNLTPRWVPRCATSSTTAAAPRPLPPNGQPGGCRAESPTGVSPPDGMPGSGRVLDDNTAAPLIAPDGSIYYGAYTRYNYAQGHLMRWSSTGQFLQGFEFGWDTIPPSSPSPRRTAARRSR